MVPSHKLKYIFLSNSAIVSRQKNKDFELILIGPSEINEKDCSIYKKYSINENPVKLLESSGYEIKKHMAMDYFVINLDD